VKAHLLDSDEPITLGGDLRANCGKEVPKAVAVFSFDGNFGQGFSFNALLCCRACMEITLSHRYVYGLLPGQEMKDAEDGA
jgi:hypothetical protein